MFLGGTGLELSSPRHSLQEMHGEGAHMIRERLSGRLFISTEISPLRYDHEAEGKKRAQD